VFSDSPSAGAPAGRVIDALATLSFVTPAALLGIGLISVWNHPLTSWLYGTVASWSSAGALLRRPPLAHDGLGVALTGQLRRRRACAGARFLRVLVFIVTPLQRRALAVGWLFALAFCLRDLETAVMYYPPGREPLAVRVFTLEANGPVAVVAALALVQVLFSAGFAAAGALLMRQRNR
jgi:iron(III) transport system permease protein